MAPRSGAVRVAKKLTSARWCATFIGTACGLNWHNRRRKSILFRGTAETPYQLNIGLKVCNSFFDYDEYSQIGGMLGKLTLCEYVLPLYFTIGVVWYGVEFCDGDACACIALLL